MRLQLLLIVCTALASYNACALQSESDTEKVICPHGPAGECYSKVFQPSGEWENVRLGQEITAGLHVRMNLETGEREAKLLSPDDAIENAGVQVVLVENGSPITSHDGESGNVPYSHKPNPYLTQAEHVEFGDNLAYVLSHTKIKTEIGNHDGTLVAALQNLEELAHEIDFGLALAEPAVANKLMTLAESHDNALVRSLAARVIGSALRNNGPALSVAMPVTNLVSRLVDALSTEADRGTRLRLMFALSSAVHGRSGQTQFYNRHGGEVLRRHFDADPADQEFMARCATFVEDVVATGSPTTAQAELGRWCSAFQDKLSSDVITSVDARIKVFSSLRQLRSLHAAYCPVQDSFLAWIAAKADAWSSSTTGTAELDQEQEFGARIAEARHVIFGNRKAGRKQEPQPKPEHEHEHEL
ncbi:hypothetical protein V1514DRAFT_340700 [Lipomyces japonicus]|uniref:uncharacterized protein n=1 Tax=Lipomyces japonicus TaxID=56871 RepID=UPI0034CFF2F9